MKFKEMNIENLRLLNKILKLLKKLNYESFYDHIEDDILFNNYNILINNNDFNINIYNNKIFLMTDYHEEINYEELLLSLDVLK